MQQARLYANLTTGGLSESLGASSGFSPQPIPARSTLIWRLALSENIGGAAAVAERTVTGIAARIGWPSTAPEEGTFQLKIGDEAEDGTNRTADIDYNSPAADLKAAIDALTDVTLAAQLPVSVTLQESTEVTTRAKSYRIVAADGSQLSIEAVDNALWPVSFIDVDEVEWDEGWVSIVTIRQTPVAATDSLRTITQTAPTVSREQDASDTDDVIIHEIQELFIPPEFAGNTFTVGFGGKKTSPIGAPVDAVDLVTKLNSTFGDADKVFTLATTTSNSIFVEFAGSDFEGTNQDLFTVTVFSARAADLYLRLPTDTAELRTLMRRADVEGEVEVPFTITLDVTDEKDGGDTNTVTFSTELTITTAVGDDSRNVAPSIAWNQPVTRTEYLKRSPDSVLVGHRGYEETIGDGAATSFSIAHNLGSVAKAVTVVAGTDIFTTSGAHNLHNGDPVQFATDTTLPDPLDAALTYWVLNRTATTFQVATASNGSVLDITDTGTGAHTVELADGAGTVMDVVVWDTGTNLRLADDAYTVELDSGGALTLSGFGSTPTLDQYRVAVMTMGRPATYQAHTHEQDEIIDLVTDLDAIRTRLTDVEAAVPAGIVSLPATNTPGDVMTVTFAPIWDVYPTYDPIVRPDSGKISEVLPLQIDPDASGKIRSRLLRAVHWDATPGTLPVADGRPDKTSMTAGTVYQADEDVSLSRGPRGRLITLREDEYCVYNGTDVYQVGQYGPTAEKTYYPKDFERVLWSIDINEKMFRPKGTLRFDFDLEFGMFLLGDPENHAEAQWSVVVEVGPITSEASPATTGKNLKEKDWSSTPLFDQAITFGRQVQRHSFGGQIQRKADGTTFELQSILYSKAEASSATLTTANFALRARLTRFDLEDAQTGPAKYTTPQGLVAVSGLGFDDSPDGAGLARIY